MMEWLIVILCAVVLFWFAAVTFDDLRRENNRQSSTVTFKGVSYTEPHQTSLDTAISFSLASYGVTKKSKDTVTANVYADWLEEKGCPQEWVMKLREEFPISPKMEVK